MGAYYEESEETQTKKTGKLPRTVPGHSRFSGQQWLLFLLSESS